MKNKSVLVGLLILMIGSGCSSNNTENYDVASTGDNVTTKDNSTRSSGIGFLPFLLGGFGRNQQAAQAPAAVAPQNVEKKSDLKARGSNSMAVGRSS